MNILGIDPGMTGAIAVYGDKGLRGVADTPTEKYVKNKKESTRICIPALYDLLNSFVVNFGTRKALMERVNGMSPVGRSMGTTSAFGFGEGYGILKACLVCCGIEFELVSPAVWKKKFDLLKTDKDTARVLAKHFYHDTNYFERKKDSGRADATLIAAYGHDYHEWRSDKSNLFEED